MLKGEMHIPLLCLATVCICSKQGYAACFGATFSTVSNAFYYQAQLSLPADGCSLNTTRVTRLFIAGACGKMHDNNFDGHPPACPPGDWNIMNTSSDTCEQVFDQASPRDIISPQGDEAFDQGKVCNNGITSVIFVQTNCSSLNASSVMLLQKALSGEYCWDGRTLSHGELAGIAIGAVVALGILIAIPLLGLAYYKKRKIKHQIEAAQDVEARHFSSSNMFRTKGPLEAAVNSPFQPADPLEDDYDSIYDVELDSDSQDQRHSIQMQSTQSGS